MKFAKSILMGTGAVVLAGFILALLAPKAVQAVVATAVLIENTPATPVPNKNVDEPARNSLSLTCTSGGNLTCNTAVVPAGNVFVAEHLFAYAPSITGTVGDLMIFYTDPTTNPIYTGFQLQKDAVGVWTVNQNLTGWYIGPVSNVLVGASGNFSTPGAVVTISGHLVPTP